MKNRYGDEYRFEKVNENTYTIIGDLKYWRYGGKEGQERVNLSDLGFVDPSGGPFIQVGMTLENRTIKKISVSGDSDQPEKILFEVE